MVLNMNNPRSQYQNRDFEVVDYDLFDLPGFPYKLRGPKPRPDRKYISVIGAGQSFGVLVRKPYVDQLRESLGIDVLNLSVGGSSPSLYLNYPDVIDICNQSSACIVQVLSARSTTSSYFETDGGKNMLRPRGSSLPFVPGDTAFDTMFRLEPQIVSELVIKEIQANWVGEMRKILERIRIPKILLWFSKRKPSSLRPAYDTYRAASGVFPQFVNQAMIDEIKPLADEYVEVVSSRGVPNVLTSRFTGEPVKVLLGDRRKYAGEDYYYPSPAMHEDAFDSLMLPVSKLLKL